MELIDINERVFVCVHGNDIEWHCEDCEALVEQYLAEDSE